MGRNSLCIGEDCSEILRFLLDNGIKVSCPNFGEYAEYSMIHPKVKKLLDEHELSWRDTCPGTDIIPNMPAIGKKDLHTRFPSPIHNTAFKNE